MSKVFLGFFSSLFFLIFVWFIIGITKYGNDIDKRHLDLYATISQLNDTSGGNGFDFVSFTDIFFSTSDKIDTGLKGLDQFLSVLITPIMVLVNIFKVVIEFCGGVFKFVFNPVFI